MANPVIKAPVIPATTIKTPTPAPASATPAPAPEANPTGQGDNLVGEANELYGSINKTMPKDLAKIKAQEANYAKETQQNIDKIKSYNYDPETITAQTPKLETLKQSLGKFGGIVTALIGIMAIREGGSSALNFANMYNGMATAIRKNNLKNFMAQSETFKDNLMKVKSVNDVKLQKFQAFFQDTLTGNKLEAQKLQAELQPEQMDMQNMFAEAGLINKTLMQVNQLQKLGWEISKFGVTNAETMQRLGLEAANVNIAGNRNQILAGLFGSEGGRNLQSEINYASEAVARLHKLVSIDPSYSKELIKSTKILDRLLALRNKIKSSGQGKVSAPAPVAAPAKGAINNYVIGYGQ